MGCRLESCFFLVIWLVVWTLWATVVDRDTLGNLPPAYFTAIVDTGAIPSACVCVEEDYFLCKLWSVIFQSNTVASAFLLQHVVGKKHVAFVWLFTEDAELKDVHYRRQIVPPTRRPHTASAHVNTSSCAALLYLAADSALCGLWPPVLMFVLDMRSTALCNAGDVWLWPRLPYIEILSAEGRKRDRTCTWFFQGLCKSFIYRYESNAGCKASIFIICLIKIPPIHS